MGSISPCSTDSLICNVSEEVATEIAENCRRRVDNPTANMLRVAPCSGPLAYFLHSFSFMIKLILYPVSFLLPEQQQPIVVFAILQIMAKMLTLCRI